MLGRMGFAAILLLLSGWPSVGEPPDRSGREGTTTSSASRPARKQPRPARQPTPPAKMVTDRAVRAMKMSVRDVRFDEAALEDVTDWLQRTTKANVLVKWKVLEKAGIRRDCPITIHESRVRLDELLRLVFVQATKDRPGLELAAHADGNTLIITTREELNSRLIVKTYEVQDLLFVVPDFAAGSGGGPGVAGGIRQGGGREREPADPAKQLIDTITQTIEPATWKVNGGKGTIVLFKGQLVIRNNLEVHQRLAELLATGRK